jgi:integrase
LTFCHDFWPGHFRPRRITTADVATFIGARTRSRGLAPKTANRYREIIVRLFNWAMEQRGVRMPGDRNPAASVERYKERAPEIRYLTLPQIDERLEALKFKPQLQTMVAMYIYAGLRREEALWLTVEDLNLRAGRCGLIHVRAKTINGEAWQPKTKRNRVVPVSTDLRGYLDQYAPRPSLGGWYFPSPKGCHWDPDGFSTDLRTANHAAGLPWGCLDYRHTFGSQLAQGGASLYSVSELMGNSPEICRRHYASLSPESLMMRVEFPMLASRPLRTSTQI